MPTVAEKELPTILSLMRLSCAKCGHTWIRRREEDPASCPACKCRKWNKETRDDEG